MVLEPPARIANNCTADQDYGRDILVPATMPKKSRT